MCPRWEQGVPCWPPRGVGPVSALPVPAGRRRSLWSRYPLASVSQCQGPTAFRSTRPLCLLASVTVTVVLEYVPFKLRVSSTACFPRGYAALSLVLGVLQGLRSVSLRRIAHLYKAVLSLKDSVCASLVVTLGVPWSLRETPVTPQALVQGDWISRSAGRGGGRGLGKEHSRTDKGTC